MADTSSWTGWGRHQPINYGKSCSPPADLCMGLLLRCRLEVTHVLHSLAMTAYFESLLDTKMKWLFRTLFTGHRLCPRGCSLFLFILPIPDLGRKSVIDSLVPVPSQSGDTTKNLESKKQTQVISTKKWQKAQQETLALASLLIKLLGCGRRLRLSKPLVSSTSKREGSMGRPQRTCPALKFCFREIHTSRKALTASERGLARASQQGSKEVPCRPQDSKLGLLGNSAYSESHFQGHY